MQSVNVPRLDRAAVWLSACATAGGDEALDTRELLMTCAVVLLAHQTCRNVLTADACERTWLMLVAHARGAVEAPSWDRFTALVHAEAERRDDRTVLSITRAVRAQSLPIDTRSAIDRTALYDVDVATFQRICESVLDGRAAIGEHERRVVAEICYARAVALLRTYAHFSAAALAVRAAVMLGIDAVHAQDLLAFFAVRQRSCGAFGHLPLHAPQVRQAWRQLHLPLTAHYLWAVHDLLALESLYKPMEDHYA